MEISGEDFETFRPSKHIGEFITVRGELEKLEGDAWVRITPEDLDLLMKKRMGEPGYNGLCIRGIQLSTENISLESFKDKCIIKVQGHLQNHVEKESGSGRTLLVPENITILDESVVTTLIIPEHAKTDFLKQFFTDFFRASDGLLTFHPFIQGVEYGTPKLENDTKIFGNLYISYACLPSISKESVEKDIKKIMSNLESNYTIIKVNNHYMFKKIKDGLYAKINVYEYPNTLHKKLKNTLI